MSRLARIAPEIPVSDLSRSTEYYETKLGFRVAMQMPEGDYAVVERDDVAIHLFRHASAAEPVSIHVFTYGLDELYAELVERGANMTQQIADRPWGCRDFRVLDDSGNTIKFTEPEAEN